MNDQRPTLPHILSQTIPQKSLIYPPLVQNAGSHRSPNSEQISIPALETGKQQQNKEQSNEDQQTQNGDNDSNFNLQPKQTSISLLARGLKLLSISHLRQLLRDYSLPTGGNKQALVQRLIIFLETFGPSQQAMVVQFSVNLKKLLSVDNEENEEQHSEEAQMQLLPPDISDKVYESSPSCLYETTDHPFVLKPVMIQSKTPSEIFEFTLLNPTPSCIPILQFAPVFQDSPLKNISFQLGNQYISLSDPVFWIPISELINKSGSFQVMQIEPSVPIIAMVRWLKKKPISVVANEILQRPNAPPLKIEQPVTNGFCPLTRKVMITPARGVQCQHLECFDLTGFLCHSIKLNKWICPICKKPLNPEDLRIDPGYFATVKS